MTTPDPTPATDGPDPYTTRPMPAPASITCPRPTCGRTSYHPDDVRFGYCGACHDFTSPPYGARWPDDKVVADTGGAYLRRDPGAIPAGTITAGLIRVRSHREPVTPLPVVLVLMLTALWYGVGAALITAEAIITVMLAWLALGPVIGIGGAVWIRRRGPARGGEAVEAVAMTPAEWKVIR